MRTTAKEWQAARIVGAKLVGQHSDGGPKWYWGTDAIKNIEAYSRIIGLYQEITNWKRLFFSTFLKGV